MSEVLATYDALAARIHRAFRPDLSDAEFGSLALDIHAFQRRWNEPYARFCATRPAPTHWREIPATPQSAFKRFALSCVPREHIGKTFLTSGTTGETRGAHHFRDTELYDAAVLGGWRRLGLPRLRQVILAPSPTEAPQSSLSHMLATLAVEAGNTEPVAMLGTALAFLHHFDTTPARVLPPGSFAMETGGYKGSGRDIAKVELYAMFERHLGLKPDDVLNEYGMTELSSQFYTRGLGGVHTGGPWVRALVINPASGAEAAIGEAGVLRIFDLANLNSSLAIETQDLAIRRADGFELLGRDPAALPRGCSRAADEMLRR
ncbi:MAG: hypothetical protein ABMA13_17285 [Chthoniobacteraceae bacterium]